MGRVGIDRRAFLGTGAAGAAVAMATGPLTAAAQNTANSLAEPERTPGPSDGTLETVDAIVSAALALRFEDLDAATVRRAKHRVLDLAGCAIGGRRGEGATSLIGLVAGSGGTAEATVLGTPTKVPAREAAMVNAVVARMYDFEVMTVVVEGVEIASHHAPTTVMAALAEAERAQADGRAFLTGMIVGDDLAARTLAAAGLDFNDGWDGVPLHATMAAALIAARLRGFDTGKARAALGLAVDQIGGTVQSLWDGGSAWKIQQGTAARNGIMAVELAVAGFSGMSDPLFAPFGLYGQFTPGCERPELLTAKLGRAWHAEEYFKPYPSCAANHTTIECALTLRERHRLDPGRVRSVRLVVPSRIARLFVGKPLLLGPSLHSQLNFSVRFACANALLRGSFLQDHYDPAVVAEPALHAMLGKVDMVAGPPSFGGARVDVTMEDGRVLSETLTGQARHYPREGGSSEADIVAKFKQQVAFAKASSELGDEILARVMRIDEEAEIGKFAALLSRAMT